MNPKSRQIPKDLIWFFCMLIGLIILLAILSSSGVPSRTLMGIGLVFGLVAVAVLHYTSVDEVTGKRF